MEKSAKIVSILISVVLISQVGFILAASSLCGPCDQNSDCNSGLICVGGDTNTSPAKEGTCQKPDVVTFCNPSRFGSISAIVQKITNWIFWLGIVVAPIMIAWGAILFMTSGGNPSGISRAKSLIMWAIIGLAILLFSRGIISLIRSILGG